MCVREGRGRRERKKRSIRSDQREDFLLLLFFYFSAQEKERLSLPLSLSSAFSLDPRDPKGGKGEEERHRSALPWRYPKINVLLAGFIFIRIGNPPGGKWARRRSHRTERRRNEIGLEKKKKRKRSLPAPYQWWSLRPEEKREENNLLPSSGELLLLLLLGNGIANWIWLKGGWNLGEYTLERHPLFMSKWQVDMQYNSNVTWESFDRKAAATRNCSPKSTRGPFAIGASLTSQTCRKPHFSRRQLLSNDARERRAQYTHNSLSDVPVVVKTTDRYLTGKSSSPPPPPMPFPTSRSIIPSSLSYARNRPRTLGSDSVVTDRKWARKMGAMFNYHQAVRFCHTSHHSFIFVCRNATWWISLSRPSSYITPEDNKQCVCVVQQLRMPQAGLNESFNFPLSLSLSLFARPIEKRRAIDKVINFSWMRIFSLHKRFWKEGINTMIYIREEIGRDDLLRWRGRKCIGA